MEFLAAIGLVLLAFGCCCWFFVLLTTTHNLRRVVLLERLKVVDRRDWPRVSLVIPACNEGDTLEPAMRSRLRETYPNLEVVVVDDRSTDVTGAIADALAAADSRVRAVHVQSLPEGWLGKVHALHQGVNHSTGDWLLFMDADVHMEPGTLERVVAWCDKRELDHITLLPQMKSASFGLAALTAAFVRLAAGSMPVWVVEHAKTKVGAGAGVFCLFRRSALERSPGMPRLRLEVIDDIGLGFMLKAYGARCSIINGAAGVSLSWYPSMCAMKRGFEKNALAMFGYRMPLLLLTCAGLVAMEWAPYVALAQVGHPWLQALGGVAAGIQLGTTVAVSRWTLLPVMPALFSAVSVPVFAWFLVRAGLLTVLRGGITWRGTKYSLQALKEFRRRGQDMPLPPA